MVQLREKLGNVHVFAAFFMWYKMFGGLHFFINVVNISVFSPSLTINMIYLLIGFHIFTKMQYESLLILLNVFLNSLLILEVCVFFFRLCIFFVEKLSLNVKFFFGFKN